MKIKRKARVLMCQKIKEVHNLSPAEILTKYWDFEDSFVNTEEVLAKMGIPCFKIDFSKLENSLHICGEDAILGLAASYEDKLIILYSQSINFNWQNYVLAHELGHCCMHLPTSAEFHVELKIGNDVYSDSSITPFKPSEKRLAVDSVAFKSKENEADEFARHLLFPKSLLEKYWKQGFLPTPQDLSKSLKVPISFAQSIIDTYK